VLGHLLAPLNVVLFGLGNDQVTAAELLGFVTGAASVWLTVLALVSNFPALATRVTDYVLENRCRFGAAITDGPRTGAETR
jgi:nicotinamide mononucleotide transporter